MKRKFQKPDLFFNEQTDLWLDVLAFHDLVGMGLHFIVIPGDTLGETEVVNLVLIKRLIIHADGQIRFLYQDDGTKWTVLNLEQSAAFAARIMEIQASILRLTGKVLPA